MNEATTWTELCRCDDPRQARTIVTTIGAMEFPVRLVNAATGGVVDPPEGGETGLWVVQVQGEHRADLIGVLDEMLAEQAEFDRAMEARKEAHRRTEANFVRWVLLILVIIVAVLAMLRSIEL